MSQVVDAETILLDINSGTYFRLNDTGTRVWSGIVASQEVEEIVAEIADECEVPQDTVRADVDALLAELVERGLLDTAV
jgi:hypothetical protein